MSDDLSGFSMMDLFRMEAEERLSVLSQGLVALEGTGATAVTIEPLMRARPLAKGGSSGRGPGPCGASSSRNGRLPGCRAERTDFAPDGICRYPAGGSGLAGADLAGLGGGTGGVASSRMATRLRCSSQPSPRSRRVEHQLQHQRSRRHHPLPLPNLRLVQSAFHFLLQRHHNLHPPRGLTT